MRKSDIIIKVLKNIALKQKLVFQAKCPDKSVIDAKERKKIMPLKSRYNANFTGDVTYGNKVVEGIIELAAKEINGVASLSGKGVKCEVVGETVNVEVFVNVYHTVSCPDMAFRVQENVKKTLESMTNYKAGNIDVNVLELTIEGAEN